MKYFPFIFCFLGVVLSTWLFFNAEFVWGGLVFFLSYLDFTGRVSNEADKQDARDKGVK